MIEKHVVDSKAVQYHEDYHDIDDEIRSEIADIHDETETFIFGSSRY